MNSGFEQIKEALQLRLPEVLAQLLPGGRISGREYICASLQGGVGSSCATNLDTCRGSDFATGETWGDVIALATKVLDLQQYEAARELVLRYRIDIGQPTYNQTHILHHSTEFHIIVPVPVAAPQPLRHHARLGRSSVLWRYADMQGHTLGYTARFDLADGKVILPLSFGQYGSSRAQWAWKALPEPRPLYNLPRLTALSNDSPVLLVEGEKTADIAQKLFPQYAVLTWSGGAAAADKADWSPLAGPTVTMWPDNDEPGYKAVLKIASLLEGIARHCRQMICIQRQINLICTATKNELAFLA